MAGLVPKRRTSDELERANNQLLEKHREHLQSWAKNKENTKAKESGHNLAGESDKKTK